MCVPNKQQSVERLLKKSIALSVVLPIIFVSMYLSTLLWSSLWLLGQSYQFYHTLSLYGLKVMIGVLQNAILSMCWKLELRQGKIFVLISKRYLGLDLANIVPR